MQAFVLFMMRDVQQVDDPRRITAQLAMINQLSAALVAAPSGPGSLWSAESAAAARELGRFSMIPRAPWRAHTVASTHPVPVVVPVMATVLPAMDGSVLRCFRKEKKSIDAN